MADSAVVRDINGGRGGEGRDGLTPGVLRPLDELAREITAGAVRLASATAAWLALVAEFDRREGWGGVGVQSCAHWWPGSARSARVPPGSTCGSPAP